jgi:SAM-dependent methyltransferase
MENYELRDAVAAIPYWYHKIELPHQVTTPGWAPLNPAAYRVPDRFDGEVLLDVGAWDGYWTFYAAQRGAVSVNAIDDFSDNCGKLVNADRQDKWRTFDLCCRALMLTNVGRITHNVEQRLPLSGFNRVFMFGVLYHLRNPIQALQNVYNCMAPGSTIHVETAILDNVTSAYTGKQADPNGCYAEFFPGSEFGKNPNNWWVPTLKCVGAWLLAAGFHNVELWKLTDTPTTLAECRGFAKARK